MTQTTTVPALRLANDELKEVLNRQVAAKILGMLPPDEDQAMHIIALVAGLIGEFTSAAAIRSGHLFASHGAEPAT